MWFQAAEIALARTVVAKLFLYCCSDEKSSYVYTRYLLCNVFFFMIYTAQQHYVQHHVFVHISLFFRHTSQADCGVCDMSPRVHYPAIPPLPVYTSTGWILAMSSTCSTATSAVKIAWTGGAIARAYVAAVGAKDLLRGRGAREFLILARQRPNQLQIRLYNDWVDFIPAWCVNRRLQWAAQCRRKSAECWKTQRDCEGLISTTSRFQFFSFVSVGDAT